MAESLHPCSCSLGRDLFAQLFEPDPKNFDLFVVAGPEGGRERLPAHKCVLNSASSVFQRRMEDRWTNGETNPNFDLPFEFSVAGAKAFVKGIYLEDFSWEHSLNNLIEVLKLSNMYEAVKIVGPCAKQMAELISTKMPTLDYCHIVWGVISVLEESGNNQNTLATLKDKCLDIIISTLDTDSSEFWPFLLWKDILKRDAIGSFREIQLFERVMLWQKDANLDKEKAELKSLIQLIRFPLMSVEDLQTIVAPTGLLNEKELTHIINYVSGAVGKIGTEFSAKPRNVPPKVARNSDMLRHFLLNCATGDFIQLTSGRFELGDTFEINVNRLWIQGEGREKSIISLLTSISKSALEIISNGVTISDLTFESEFVAEDSSYNNYPATVKVNSCNSLRNVGFKSCPLTVTGNFCELEDLTFKLNSENKAKWRSGPLFRIEGSHNNVVNFKMEKAGFGLKLEGSQNHIKNFQCVFVSRGISIEGSDNYIESVTYNCSEIDLSQISFVIWVSGGINNTISGVKCTNLTYNQKPNFCIASDFRSENNKFYYCGPGNVCLCGKNNVMKVVDCGQWGSLEIMGSGHYLENCQSEKISRIEPMEDVTLFNCNFTL